MIKKCSTLKTSQKNISDSKNTEWIQSEAILFIPVSSKPESLISHSESCLQSQTHIKAHQGITLPKSHTFPHYAEPETSREFGDKEFCSFCV